MNDLDYFDARIKAKKIPIKPSKTTLRSDFTDMIAWTKSPPFAVNPRAVLVHRVRHVTTYIRDGKDSHHAMHYLCGNGCTVSLDAIVDALVADPPADRFLCAFCEAVAERKELPSGDTLAGRHVHRGVLVAKQVCCQGDHS